MKTLQIWTDGSCTPSNGNGGIGVVFVYEGRIVHEISKGYRDTTNNQMEIMAILAAIQSIKQPIDELTVYTDSQYCVGMLTKNWRAAANTELWEKVSDAVLQLRQYCPKTSFVHTKGHDSDRFNNRADLLATIASGYRKASADFELVQWKPGDKPVNLKFNSMVIALDFDGTVVEHQYPEIGKDIGAVPVLRALQEKGHQFILYTMRDNHSCGRNCLKEAADWFAGNNINLIGVNCNPWQKTWTDSDKVYAPLYIDDAALGAPLKQGKFGRPYIDWVAIVSYFAQRGIFTEDEALALQKQII